MTRPSTGTAQASPTKQFFVSMLTRDISLADAILDLLDNCLDGAMRLTAALVICKNDDKAVEELVKGWEFYATADAPHRLDLPALSTLERLTMESNVDAKTKMGFELPKSDMGEDPFEVFKKFYRIYPHFSRVEL